MDTVSVIRLTPPRATGHLPKETTFTTRTRCSNGTNLKFTACTAGQTIQFFANAVEYVLSNFSLGLEPSMMAMLLKNTNKFVDANTDWSVSTRAAMVRLAFWNLIFSWRNLNHVVAAGPKTADQVGHEESASYTWIDTAL